MIVMEWDDRMGTHVLSQYPKELEVTSKTLMQVYFTHEYNKEAGIVSLMVGQTSLLSYYSGPDYNIYVILVMLMEENTDHYEEGLVEVSNILLQNLQNEEYLNLVPSLFNIASVYPSFDESLKLMMFYSDKMKRLLLERLREEGSTLKSEIKVWYEELFSNFYYDFDHLIDQFVKLGIVKQTSIKQ